MSITDYIIKRWPYHVVVAVGATLILGWVGACLMADDNVRWLVAGWAWFWLADHSMRWLQRKVYDLHPAQTYEGDDLTALLRHAQNDTAGSLRRVIRSKQTDDGWVVRVWTKDEPR